MKVALVAFSVKGAMGQYVGGLASALARQDEVVAFLPSHFDRSRLSAGVEARYFPTGHTRARALARLLNPVAGAALAREIAAAGPDVVHLLNGEGYPWAAILARHLAAKGIPFVVTLHDPVSHAGDLVDTITRFVAYRFTLPRATRIHVHAPCFVDVVASATGLPKEHVLVVPHPSFADCYLPHQRSGVRKEERTILFFGRLEYYKGLDTLIRAMVLLKQQGQRFLLVVAGPGRFSPSVEQLAAEHKDLFEFHTRFLSEEEVAVLFQRASLCVLPYRDATQSAIPSIAAAFGVPILATAVGAFTVDVPFYGGTLVPPDDPPALAQAIPEAMKREPANAQARSFDEIAKCFREVYLDVSGD